MDVFTLKVDARNNWSSAGYANLAITLYYDDLGVRIPLATTTSTLNDAWIEQTLVLNASLFRPAWDSAVGIELANVTPGASDSWIGIDNVRLTVVPEPGMVVLLSSGLLTLALLLRRP